MPKGGFGNLIALPLQRRARDMGNSVFVDMAFKPWHDQWAFLASVKRLDAASVCALPEEASRRGQVIGVRICDTGDEHAATPWTRLPSGLCRKAVITETLPPWVNFEFKLVVRETGFSNAGLPEEAGIQELYAALAQDQSRNDLIFDDVVCALEEGRSPILLTDGITWSTSPTGCAASHAIWWCCTAA